MPLRREDKKRETRELLERAALELFATNGYEATSVAEIARQAHVTERTYFRYFPTKDEVLFFRAAEHQSWLEDALRVTVVSNPPTWDELTEAMRLFAERLNTNRAWARGSDRLMNSTPVLLARLRLIEHEWANGAARVLAETVGRPPDDPAMGRLAGILVVVMTTAWQTWVNEDDGPDLVEHVLLAAAETKQLICPEPLQS